MHDDKPTNHVMIFRWQANWNLMPGANPSGTFLCLVKTWQNSICCQPWNDNEKLKEVKWNCESLMQQAFYANGMHNIFTNVLVQRSTYVFAHCILRLRLQQVILVWKLACTSRSTNTYKSTYNNIVPAQGFDYLVLKRWAFERTCSKIPYRPHFVLVSRPNCL